MTRIVLVLLILVPVPARAVTIDWTPVGNPGNAADPTVMTDGTKGYGSVGYNYNIDKYDVTNTQYVEFLNAKDASGANTLDLYNPNMSSSPYGGIIYNSGAANGGKYNVIGGDGNHPVNFVTWFDAIRFANWLNNGQGNGNTENGAYTLLGGTPTPLNWLDITRNAGATVFLPSENEWYKAAYFNPGTNSYSQYGIGSNATPIATRPTALVNHANYNNAVGNLTDVGAYSGTTSPYGAFDMAGNVLQWNETLFPGAARGVRGGSFDEPLLFLVSSERNVYVAPSNGLVPRLGFRVAETPEPSSLVLAALGFMSLYCFRRR